MPKLDPEALKRAAEELPARLEQMRKDEDDERCLTGKFAPAWGICVVCRGNVKARIAYPSSDLIGGPPMQAYVSGWECSHCHLLYGQSPK
jgi:hypothetical protein